MDKIFKNNAYRIIELFMLYPDEDFSIREIARELKLNHSTVINHMKMLHKLGLIKRKNDTLYPTHYANTENVKYKIYKRNYILFHLLESGLVEHIKEKTLASSIVLFGSCAKGAFNQKSDLDIFVEAKEQKLNLNKYEQALKRKINLLFEPNINTLSDELRNNIINGIALAGFIKIRGRQHG